MPDEINIMDDDELDWWVASEIMGVTERPTSGIGSLNYGGWGYPSSRSTCSQAEYEIGKLPHALRNLYASTIIKASWDKFDAITASPRRRCEVMYQIRDEIVRARKATNQDGEPDA